MEGWSLSWKDLLVYVFPTFDSLIPKILQKIRQEKATIIAIIPFRHSRGRFPLISELLRGLSN